MLSAFHLPEPKLLFANDGEAESPCVGLTKYGPRGLSSDPKYHRWIGVGFIGSAKSISLSKNLLESMNNFSIPPKREKPWNITFPGLGIDSPLRFSLCFRREWETEFAKNEIKSIYQLRSKGEKVEKLLQVIDKKLQIISEKETPPNVVIISIPEEIEKVCTEKDTKAVLLKTKTGEDFHNRIKVYGMRWHMPTQIIRPRTLYFRGTQDKSMVAWNLAVGILYKSQKGHPWKISKLEKDTCYVGISFYREFLGKKEYKRTSMAQIFLDTGESFVLRGDPFEWKSRSKPNSPHLDRIRAKKLIEKVLKQYHENRGNYPSRLVVHKSSNYWPEEKEGFFEGTENLEKIDLVTITESPIRFFRPGKFATLRGTLVKLPGNTEYLLYTTGYVGTWGTFPGYGTPRPLLIRIVNEDADPIVISKEILSMTKLDWNNTFIYRRKPVTLAVSMRVGRILSESEAKNIKIDPHYYFYM
ncbi:MAG TPA: hypothetical protein ENI51_00350 [Candidatus Atribacteria bacterium]|nr:hypothetical protein [Candidatus Atribacteria bacterium]